MITTQRKLALGALLAFLLLSLSSIANAAMIKGIYITQPTFEDNERLNYLIQRSKKVGLSTFIVDLEIPSKHYEQNVALLKANNIKYIARIIMYPDGGTPQQIDSEARWEKKYNLIQHAIAYGASQIQLDYIRYNTQQPASSEHAKHILKIIEWYKTRLAKQSIPLQVDVFGITSFGEEKHIGQSIKLFSQAADVLCPMVYPSHFEPFRVHAVTPYKTIYDSLESIRAQFDNKPLPFKLIPYIELSNYRYPLSKQKKLSYIHAQIQAAEAAGADGWYAWSPNNLYDNLFTVLENNDVK